MAALEAARRRAKTRWFIGEAEFYCEGVGCVAREVTIVIKELDGPRAEHRGAALSRRSNMASDDE
jgi:hypothetical protein